jgi:hypothetical protein
VAREADLSAVRTINRRLHNSGISVKLHYWSLLPLCFHGFEYRGLVYEQASGIGHLSVQQMLVQEIYEFTLQVFEMGGVARHVPSFREEYQFVVFPSSG